jgi:hypothetical protein
MNVTYENFKTINWRKLDLSNSVEEMTLWRIVALWVAEAKGWQIGCHERDGVIRWFVQPSDAALLETGTNEQSALKVVWRHLVKPYTWGIHLADAFALWDLEEDAVSFSLTRRAGADRHWYGWVELYDIGAHHANPAAAIVMTWLAWREYCEGEKQHER